jgi:hypothetical protein
VRVLKIDPGANVTLQDLTITKGSMLGSFPDNSGGEVLEPGHADPERRQRVGQHRDHQWRGDHQQRRGDAEFRHASKGAEPRGKGNGSTGSSLTTSQ